MIAALHLLSEPWSEPIMRRAALECVLLAFSGGLLGCWLVLYRLSYATESLAHGMLPGLVAATLLGVPLLVGGAAGLALAAAGVALATRVPLVSRDSAVAVTVTTLLGLGAVLALSPDSPPGLQNLLFGDILGVGDTDLLAAAALAALVACALPFLHHPLLAAGFDREASGLRPARAEAALLSLLAAALLVAVQGMGNLLVVAVLIAPAAAAAVLTRRVPAMMAVSVGIAVTGCLGGLYLSYYAATAAAASIAAVLVALFLGSRVIAVSR